MEIGDAADFLEMTDEERQLLDTRVSSHRGKVKAGTLSSIRHSSVICLVLDEQQQNVASGISD